MKKVVYYTSPYLFDISLEMINILKTIVELHVLVEITPSSKNVNIVNLESLPVGKTIVDPKEIFSVKDYSLFQPYFEGVASINFVVHKHPNGMSFSTLRVNSQVKKMLKRIKPDILHFENFSMRTVGLATIFPFIKKIILTVHDGTVHSGEYSLKTSIPRFVFFKIPFKKTYIFYSKFVCNEFTKREKIDPQKTTMLKLSPYSYFNRLSTGKPSTHDHLLFFGRISKYKGVDILLDAMPDILSKHPNEKLIIAGKGADEALLNHPSLKKYSQNITFLNRYIPNEELVELIKGAKMVICPYRDASQSGVLMTSFALNKPVIAADTGAFSEDVKNNENGLLIKNITPKNLSNAIEQALAGETYLAWEKNLDQTNQENPWEQNISILKKAYS